ncbi:hypothetical protein BT69DRAFT_1333613 [Atractiella rhizophila]|nr:hypothetical protein BT69DRAFT_1333613 [Atractiella rhizophila]
MEVSLLEDSLKLCFNLTSPAALQYLLQHLSTSGFIERLDGQVFSSPSPTHVCVFPLPSLIDPSPVVETLVVAVDSCLSDSDLSVQECGLILLSTRAWPTSFSSAYALDRLCRIVLKWVLDDVSLFELTRARVDQAAGNVNARGSSVESLFDRRTPPVSGGEYMTLRAILLRNLAMKWMKALHDEDAKQYATFLFTHTASISAGARSGIADNKTEEPH